MRTVLMDANNAIWRIANTVPELRTPKGKPVQVVYGMLRLIRKSITDFNPNRVLLCWDMGPPEYRLKIFPGYKQKRYENRTEDEESRREGVFYQVKVLCKLLPLINVSTVSYPGMEADDLIAAATQLKELGKKVILSGDKDMFQLIRPGVKVWTPHGNGKLYTAENFEKKIGLTPQGWLEHRILCGDSSDCIPSVTPGIGEKSAHILIKKYGTVLDVFSHRHEVTEMGVRYARLFTEENVYKNIKRNRDLMTLGVSPLNKVLKQTVRESCGEGKVQIPEIKQAFLQRAFISMLADFGEWIVPFKTLD